MRKWMAGFLALVSVVAVAQQPSEVKLEQLAFIAGKWKNESGADLYEEHWTAPHGDNMVGMYRHVRDGKVKMYELLAIEQTANGPVLRLKHFDLGLVGREEKADSMVFHLVAYEPGVATFERDNKEARLTFRKTPGGLTVGLGKLKDGKWSEFPFVYEAF